VAIADDGLEVLGERECLRLLEQGRFGRVAVVRDGIPIVLPVAYALLGGEVTFFTAPGLKLDAAKGAELVSFEVDHFDAEERSGWSVLAVGWAAVAGVARRSRAQALGLYPGPAGDRPDVVRIRTRDISGRRILTGAEPGARSGGVP
jgi:hypothetical protein